MSFGKKPSSAASPPPPPPPQRAPDPHGRRKVFPDEIWEGPQGDLLRQLGMSPDDESNLVPNESSIAARLEEGKRRLDARTAEAHARAPLAGAQLRPFFLIPDPCWKGECGLFLMTTLDLYPYDDWNVVFLAADERTAFVLDIAIHPNGNVPAFVHAAEKFMDQARARMQRVQDEVSVTQNFAVFGEARDDARLRVQSLALSFARALMEAWEKNKGGPAR